MHTPSEDEPGTMPLAIARARARDGRPAIGAPAEPASDGANGNGSNGTNGRSRAPEAASPPQISQPAPSGPQPAPSGPQPAPSGPQPSQGRLGRPRLRVPRFKWPQLSVPWLRRLILVAWPVGLAAAGVALYLCYLAVSRTWSVYSDGASNALQAWDMLHGNPLLRGWTLTDVSFYTTELPEYMIVEAVRGLNADVLHASAAITYTLVVLTGGLLGRGQAKGREGMVRMLIAAGILVAPQLGSGVFILVLQPDHIGTQVPLMLTWLVLDRAPRSWYVPPVIALMLAWGAVGDSLVLLIGVAPLAAVSAIRAYQVLVQRREGWRRGWFDVSLLLAAAAGAEISRIVVRELSAHGGYTVLPVQAGVAQVTDMSAHLWLLVQSVCILYGTNLCGMTSIGLNGAIAILHLIGLALAAWGLWRVVRHFFSCEDRIAQILALAIGVNMVAYLLSTTPTSFWSAREVAGILPAGAVLAARMLGRRLWKARLVPALSVAMACYLAALGYTVAQPSIPAVSQPLADWLAANHLTYGLTSYGLANVTTLASGETVNLRSVTFGSNEVAGGPYEFDESWYDPTLHYANFVVVLQPHPYPIDPIALWQVKDTFGKPVQTLHFRQYEILIFNKNLLTDLVPSLPPPPPS
jgi:hypothetical protein